MLTCAHCSYTTTRTFNLKRHINSKHCSKIITSSNNSSKEQNINIEEQNINMEEQFINMEEQNINMEEQNINMEEQFINIENITDIEYHNSINEGYKQYKCEYCYKFFVYKKTLKRHINVCKKKKHPHECIACHKVFACAPSLCVHRKSCIGTYLVTYEDTNNELVNIPIATNVIDTQNVELLQNIQNQNNIQTQNNTQNITINVFPSSLQSDFSIDTSHFDVDKLKHKLKHQSIYEAVGTSLRLVLENRDNLPVKKKNIKSNYSYVHLGDDKWEMRKDKEIYAMISFHISRCIQVYLEGKNLNQLKKYYQEATEALEFASTDMVEDLEKEYVKKAMRIMDIIFIATYDRPDRDKLGTIINNSK